MMVTLQSAFIASTNTEGIGMKDSLILLIKSFKYEKNFINCWKMMNLCCDDLFELIGKISKFNKEMEIEFKDQHKEKQFISELASRNAEISVKMKDGTKKKTCVLVAKRKQQQFSKEEEKCYSENIF
jgi:hypothetical protein